MPEQNLSTPASDPAVNPAAEELTPQQIVAELDRYIVGQAEAKRVVAIALRNRMRRRRLDPALREEVSPKNIIMIGPTGVGKTEIARRLARLARAPFIKVEASKYTEVGYVGRDVESMVRDLVETAVAMVRDEMTAAIRAQAERRAREHLLDLLGPAGARRGRYGHLHSSSGAAGHGSHAGADAGTHAETSVDGEAPASRESLARQLDAGELEDREVEVEVASKGGLDGIAIMPGMDEQAMGSMREVMERLSPQRKRRTHLAVAEARRVLVEDEIEQLLDKEKINREALSRAEQMGIIFVDEIDKVAGRQGMHGADVSREGVQRDILPIVEGCNVATKYGSIRTDHILFIAAGAFHVAKPSDLIPELQGRFPLRVELTALTVDDFKRILTEPQHSLLKQYVALLATDGVELSFGDDAVDELARAAARINSQAENIGARRLHTIIERVLDPVSFAAPDQQSGKVHIDRAFVKERLAGLLDNEDLSRFIL